MHPRLAALLFTPLLAAAAYAGPLQELLRASGREAAPAVEKVSAAAAQDAAKAPTFGTAIEGVALLGPMCPGPSRTDRSCPDKPFAGARITVWRPWTPRQKAGEAVTDAQGKFRISVGPGRYFVVGESDKPLPRGSEQEVIVHFNGSAPIVVRYDTGIR
ncbi:MAG: hypothetical protein HY059_18785 [Proteobacteria bacterium]|nr:hypothetical protein [Pseudomonadota bacterium]